jgi:hypothetical protein
MKSRCNFRPHIYRPAPIQPSISLPVPLPDLRPIARGKIPPRAAKSAKTGRRSSPGRLARLIASGAWAAGSAHHQPRPPRLLLLQRRRRIPRCADLPEGRGPRRRRRRTAAPTCRREAGRAGGGGERPRRPAAGGGAGCCRRRRRAAQRTPGPHGRRITFTPPR